MPNPTSGTKWMYDTTPIPKSVDKDRLIGVLARSLLAICQIMLMSTSFLSTMVKWCGSGRYI